MIKQNNNTKLINKYLRTGFISAHGITLIALVITIVVLIILAGVAINLSLGENGIFKRAEEAKQEESESTARERLELVLVDARIEKETNTSYNGEDYLTEMLEEENITVNGDAVIVDNYNFIIDRENLTILESLGETQIKVTAEVQEYLGKNENDKYSVSMLLVIESNTGLQSVVIQNPEGTTFEIETGQAILGKDMEVEIDEEYILTVTTKDGTTETRKIVEKSEEKIRTAEELAIFRDKVNTGLTYEGKTINVVNDLDLSSVCGEDVGSWEPIGNYGTDTTNIFKGIFNGNYHTIDNLYINTTNNYQGLFGCSSGIIQNLVLNNIFVYQTSNDNTITNTFTGGIASRLFGKIINCGIENGNVSYIKLSSNNGTTQWNRVGGIAGWMSGEDSEISNCYNKAVIKGENVNVKSTQIEAGGIAGKSAENGIIKDCYNLGDIEGIGYQTICGGIVGISSETTIKNSYNIGSIKGTAGNFKNIAGIVGLNGYNNNSFAAGSVLNCYCTTETTYLYQGTTNSTSNRLNKETLKTYDSKLGDAYTSDVQNEDGTWKYNDGYPILKWQIGE